MKNYRIHNIMKRISVAITTTITITTGSGAGWHIQETQEKART